MFNNLTSIQQQFWTLNQIQENDSAYNIISSVKIIGKLDIERLIESWNKVINIIPLFKELLIKEHSIEVHQCSIESEALALIKTFINKPINLNNESPVKAYITSIDNEINIFTIKQHHIVTDLHSVNIISKLLGELYNTGSTNIELKPYYESLNSTGLKDQGDFWKEYMENSPNPLVLPSKESGRNNFDGSGNTIYKSYTESITQDIRNFSIENNIQPFLLHLTSYAVFLSKISSQNDFFIGVPFSNRRDSERKEMCGPFINILPVRVSITHEDTFILLYQKIRKQMLQLHRNQEIPFKNISQYYRCSRDLKVPYLLQVGFTQEEAFNVQLDGLDCRTVNIRPDGAQMDLFLTFWYENDTLQFRWEYNTQAFSEKQVKVWQEIYNEIVNSFVSDKDQALFQVPFITENYRNIINEYSKNQEQNYPLDKPFRNHLIDSYIKYSENIAIKDDMNSYTYHEFSENVKKYASYFHDQIGSGHNIAVVLDRSIDRTALIHAIICSGNSYIPIDALWPKDRVQFLIENAGVTLTVVDKKLQSRIPMGSNFTLLEELKNLDRVNNFPNISIKADAPIAVLYTSGSTGKPKGVVISGKGIINRLFWMQESYPIGAHDTLIHKVPYTFDVSIWEIFWSFLTGATLFIPDPIRHIDDQYLAEVIREHSITYVHFVPSLLKKFFQNTSVLTLPDLKGVICSGETLEVTLVKEFFRRLPGKDLHNLYGPTEASIDVTAWTCSPHDIEGSQIPIGLPIANTRIYILNEDKLLCPPNVYGEIAIAGVSLAHGYVNNREETSKQFISGDWGWGEETIYLTGDLGYSSEDYCIHYLGRKDFQVKINGIRIELQEIERQLEKNPSIRSAIVLINDNIPEENQLAAYILTSAPLDIDQLKKELVTFLPGYMIPNFYHILDVYPMLTNGKISRKELLTIPLKKNIAGKRSDDSQQLTNIESQLQRIWQKILNIKDIALNANFFDLGGHSSLLPQLKTEIENISGTNIELIDLFKFPTITSQVSLFSHKKKEQRPERVVNRQREKMRRIAIRNRKSPK